MSRLIFVPQYPTPLRYQEWWYKEFPRRLLGLGFDHIITLAGGSIVAAAEASLFAPTETALEFEAQQIRQYMDLQLEPDDTLLLADLSYPGLFANVLFHKRPKHCYAICHATSLNRYDYFADNRKQKWPIEMAQAKMFDLIFVASAYHYVKLALHGIDVYNMKILRFPLPPFPGQVPQNLFHERTNTIVSVARGGIQKRTVSLEKKVERALHTKIKRPQGIKSWQEYYTFLANSKVLLITSKEETYGYQVIDAITNGCIPVAPRAFSYPELLPNEYLYSSADECLQVINEILTNDLPVPNLLVRHEAEAFYKSLSMIMSHA